MEIEKMELEKVESPAVKEVAGRAKELQTAAEQLKVVDEKSDCAAKELLSEIRRARKRLEDLRKTFVAPLNEHVKKINAFFSLARLPLENGDVLLCAKMLEYLREQREKAEKEQKRQERLAIKRQGTADRQARGQGEEAAPPVIIPIAPQPEKTTKTEAGTVTMREDWKGEVIDETQIPRTFLTPDLIRINDAIRLGARDIPGVRIYKTETPVTRGG